MQQYVHLERKKMTSEVEFHDLDVGDPDGRLRDPLLVVIVPLTSVQL